MRSQRLHFRPVVMRKPRSRAAFQRTLAQYQLSSKTCVRNSRDRLKAADALFHQRDLALEGYAFGLTGPLLPVQLWRQRTTALQQDVQPLYQAMADDALLISGRMML